MMSVFVQEDIAKSYVQFRPRPSSDAIDAVLKYIQESRCKQDYLLDIACGSGQSTLVWAEHFKTVVGIDKSEAQISQTPSHIPNVKFWIEDAENLKSFQGHSIDVITVHVALHWFNREKFYTEVKRVLKPGGVLAVYGYSILAMDNKEAEAVINEFTDLFLCKGRDWIYERIKEQYDGFPGVILPFNNFKRIDNFKMVTKWSLNEYMGFTRSRLGVQYHLEANPGSTLLQDIAERLKDIFGIKDPEHEAKITATWPVYILLGTN